MTDQSKTPNVSQVDDDARWLEIQAMSKAIAYRDEPPNPVESALCGAVRRAQQWRADLAAAQAALEAWQSVFCTSQLSHAKARLEAAEEGQKRAQAALEQAKARELTMRNLVDRGVKMFWLAVPETREPVHSDSHNPITSWVADATAALKGAK